MQTAKMNRLDEIIQSIYCSGNGPLTVNLSNAAAVDAGNGQVKIPISNDIYNSPSLLYIEGTTNYDGLRKVVSAPAGYLQIKAPYIAETFAGTETAKVAYAPQSAIEIQALTLRLSAVPSVAENLTITIDDGLGSNYDIQIHQVDLNGVTADGYLWTPSDKIVVFKDSVIRLTWANADSRTYGLKLVVKIIQS